MDETLADSIICFLEIQLDCHEFRIGFASLEAVEDLLNDDLVFSDPLIRNES